MAHHVKRPVHRVRAGVAQAAGGEAVHGLPVPAAGEAVEIEGVLHRTAELSAGDDFAHLHVGGREAVLLEDKILPAVLLCGLQRAFEVVHVAGRGLLGQHVKAVGEQVVADAGVVEGEGSVDYEVDVGAAEQLAIVAQRLHAVFALDHFAAFLVLLHKGDELILVGQLQKELSVDISAASAITNQSNTNFLQGKHPPCIFNGHEAVPAGSIVACGKFKFNAEKKIFYILFDRLGVYSCIKFRSCSPGNAPRSCRGGGFDV